jgi:SPP1 family holin
MNINFAGVDKIVFIRALITVIAALNLALGYLGWHIIPVSETELGEFIDAVIVLVTVAIWAWGWWKNNSFTVNAQTADAVLKQLNREGDI